MKLGFVVNRLETERPLYTTTLLAMAAASRGHEAWTIGVGSFIYAADGSLHAIARLAPTGEYSDPERFHEARKGEASREERIALETLDVLLLRYDPAEDAVKRPWAQTAGIIFAELAMHRNVIVLNDPTTLARALNKTYFQHFPEQVRPRTCISRDIEEIKEFIHEEKGRAVIKPLQGSGGHGVFLVEAEDGANTNQMIEAVIRDGYAIVQEYLPAAAEGDTRLFVMNGSPLVCDGEYAAIRRVRKGGDLRSNSHAGGGVERAAVNDEILGVVEIVRPKLLQDGMWLVGLDVAGDKLMEINVFSPGGLHSAGRFTGKDFAAEIVRDLEHKVSYKRHYRDAAENITLATL